MHRQKKNTVAKAETERLYHRALDYLAYRPRSRQELLDYLEKRLSRWRLPRREQARVIPLVLKRLESLGLVDDVEFVRWWVSQRVEADKPRGFRWVCFELRKKGIDPNLVKRVWQELAIDELALCRKAAMQRVSYYNLRSLKERRRFFAYLVRRGFAFESVRKVMEELIP